ncbi:MAG TPA: MoaD/ThiS family protein [Vicinamibacterales bacterium]
MSVTVNFPASLSHLAGQSVIVRESVSNVGQLIEALDRIAPGMARELDDPLYNIAINQEIMLHSVDSRPVNDGDVVEIIPSLAGG